MPRKVSEIDQEVRELAGFMQEAYRRLNKLEAKNKKDGVYISLVADLWPPKDWLRLEVRPWEPGKYFQIAVGPFRLDIFE